MKQSLTVDEINLLSKEIIGAAIEVHRVLGPGLLEQTYQAALKCELMLRGMNVRSEVEIPFIYKGIKLDVAYRADLLVENEIIIELKATDKDNPLFCKQLQTYLRLAGKKLGLLINFNHDRLMEGLKRVVYELY